MWRIEVQILLRFQSKHEWSKVWWVSNPYFDWGGHGTFAFASC